MTTPSFPARLHDGASAAAHAVVVTLAGEGLRLDQDGIAESIVPYAELIFVDADKEAMRIGRRDAPEFRLILPLDARAALEARAPQLRGHGQGGRMAALVAGLVAASVALGAAVFVGAPMAAEPLAHRTPAAVEDAIGENVAAQIRLAMRPCPAGAAAPAEAAARALVDRLAAANGVKGRVEVTFVRTSAPNAIALPGRRIFVTAGLLDTLETGDEFSAVIAHEMAHVAARDGLVALYRHAGLGLMLEIITGGSGVAQQLVLLSGQLTELRYTRAQEQRADDRAIETLARLGHDPAALGHALARLKSATGGEDEGKRRFDVPEWIESHPDIDARIAAARAQARPGATPTLSDDAWATIRAACTARDQSDQ